MKERTDRIAALLEKALRGELSPEEEVELETWLSEQTENKELYQQLTDQDQLLDRLNIQDKANSQAMWQKTMSRINPGATVIAMPGRRNTWKWAAAAAVVLAISGVVYFQNQKPADDAVAKTEQQEKSEAVKSDEIVPGGKHAVLTLADGSIVELDKSPDGDLSKQGDLSLSKTDGHLTYSGRFITSGPVSTGAEKHASLHNMVSTPRGGQYQITLPDGSRVWLNAASSLRFPLAFAGNQRIVEVTGEAYFEVASVLLPGSTSQKMPFIVRVHKNEMTQDVEVLGTHFNVNAYEDETVIKTTLIEGSVQVRLGTELKKIIPGQQAIAEDGKLNVKKTDVDKAIAWKDGFFGAEGTTRTVMNQIARWYDIDIAFDQGINPDSLDPKDAINLSVPLNSSFEVVMKSLESQNVHLKIEKRKLIVVP